MKLGTLNIFYKEQEFDRWIKYDRYPRKLLRRLIHGKPKASGVRMVVLELMKGLDKIDVSYRFNDFKYADAHPDELVCIIGTSYILFNRTWKNPILFGAGVFSHPIECPNLFEKMPNIKKILVPGEWMKKMFEPFYGEKVISWPVGIDTKKWNPFIKNNITTDFLIYDKIRWQHDVFEGSLINPIVKNLESNNLSFEIIRYGFYTHEILLNKLSHCKFVIFLCEHETQGLAYQQILATNTPILAWDRGSYWQDPLYYPDLVKYEPVSSVPYWDDRCGVRFKNIEEFPNSVTKFIREQNKFSPLKFIEENLSLEICAKKYVQIINDIRTEN